MRRVVRWPRVVQNEKNSVPSIIRLSLRLLTGVALIATGLLSCDSPSEPKPSGGLRGPFSAAS